METQNQNNQRDNKPVGYGSSIQSSGHGNLNRPQNPEDVKEYINEEETKTKRDENSEQVK